MAQEKTNATRRQTNLPNESDKYLSKREELRLAEIEPRPTPFVLATLRSGGIWNGGSRRSKKVGLCVEFGGRQTTKVQDPNKNQGENLCSS